MNLKTRLDYVEFYANKLKEDNSFFNQQKTLVESQLKSSSSVFKKMFSPEKKFKDNAREYLKNIGLI
jgi:hypothetical protein